MSTSPEKHHLLYLAATLTLACTRLHNLRTPTARPVLQVEKHEPLWAKHLFLKEASWSDHWSVMKRIRIALAFDTTAEVSNPKRMLSRDS